MTVQPRVGDLFGLDYASSPLPVEALAAAVDNLWTPVVRFNGVAWQQVADDGVMWLCENLDGWADIVPSTEPVQARTFDHGGWAGRAWALPRALTLTGVLFAPTRVLLQAALHVVRAGEALARMEALVLAVDELDGTKTLGVRSMPDKGAVTYLTPTTARIVVHLVAPWPIKRGDPQSVTVGLPELGTEGQRHYRRPDERGFRAWGRSSNSGDALVVNRGNALTRPRYTFTGPLVNPRVVNAATGARVGVVGSLAADNTVTVDVDTHAVRLNGVANYRYALDPASSWWDLLPGRNVLQFRADSGSGTLTVESDSGWW